MKNIFKSIVFFAFFSMVLISCQEDPEPGGTATQAAAGEWWVHVAVETEPGVYQNLSSYVKVSTFNTSSNRPDSIWIADLGNIWDFQVKAGFNKAANTFSISEAVNLNYDDSQVTIEDGKVLLGQGTSTSGVKTDSIFFVASFNDETDADDNPTPYATKYVISGHRRTGYLEDEHE